MSHLHQIVDKSESLGLTDIRIVKSNSEIVVGFDHSYCMFNIDWNLNSELYDILYPGLFEFCRIVLCLSYNEINVLFAFYVFQQLRLPVPFVIASMLLQISQAFARILLQFNESQIVS